MPRIPDQLQHSVAFLYLNEEAATQGKAAGGTGFIVRYPAGPESKSALYLITNTHVAQGANRTARINVPSGSSRLLNINGGDWITHPNGDDISVVALTAEQAQNVTAMNWPALAATPARIGELNMGIGDEIFMLGRFITSGGEQLNQPLARFGNVAMMPGQPVKDGRGMEVEAFLIEMRSLSGFSGSPVFVYMGPGTYRGNGTMMPFYSETIGLIGIDTGHRTTIASVQQREGNPTADLVVPLNTGISIVSPVWKIAEALHEIATRVSQ